MQSTHDNCHWLVLLTLEGDWALWRDPSMSVTADLTSPFPLSGNKGYIHNRDVLADSILLHFTKRPNFSGIGVILGFL